MATQTANNPFNDQFQNSVIGPARAYAELALNHFEKLVSLQYDSARAYTDLGVQQTRAALEVKDQAGVQSYLQSQQKAAQAIGERVKGDAEKVASLNQAFVENAQKTAQAAAANGRKK
jgi:phasin family protein